MAETLLPALTVAPETSIDTLQQMDITAPELWSIERPYLYQVRTTLLADGRAGDT